MSQHESNIDLPVVELDRQPIDQSAPTSIQSPIPSHSSIPSQSAIRSSQSAILQKAVAGERLTPDEGLLLLQSRDLASIGRAADEVTRRLHPEPYRTYNIDRNINYTNVC